jgi:hypothetical protein
MNGIFCEQTVTEFIELQTAIEFSIEKESWNLIHFLDLTIYQENNKINFNIPKSYTDITVHITIYLHWKITILTAWSLVLLEKLPVT